MLKHDIVLHTSTTASSSSARLMGRSTNVTSRHVMTRVTRRACRVVTCGAVTQQVEFRL